jgi:hypothetical protein
MSPEDPAYSKSAPDYFPRLETYLEDLADFRNRKFVLLGTLRLKDDHNYFMDIDGKTWEPFFDASDAARKLIDDCLATSDVCAFVGYGLAVILPSTISITITHVDPRSVRAFGDDAAAAAKLIQQCWNVGALGTESRKKKGFVPFSVSSSSNIEVMDTPPADEASALVFQSGRRAIFRCTINKTIPLPPGQYRAEFDAKNMTIKISKTTKR